uniref:SH2 domain-containing protein n=1 Tax=Onchocerca volvulus TaxID=6282 RepID=A0A8R1TPX2_ONCVO
MISYSNVQQPSSMLSTSEFDDSREEFRQAQCCVHGRPCTMASKLSQVLFFEKKEADRDSLSGSYSLIDSGRRNLSKKSEPHIYDDISYNLGRKVEREALDIPICKWNFRRPHSSSSILSFEPVASVAEIESAELLSIPTKDKHIRRKMERLSRSRTLDAPSLMKQRIFPKEKYNEYEMMHPTDSSIILAPMSAEEVLWTARAYCSVEVPPSVEAYIGIMTAKRAEEYVIKPASFKLYHMLPKIESLNNVLPSLGLYIIYRSSTGRTYHYPIRQYKQHLDYSKRRSKVMLNNLQVDYGDPLAPWFFNLDALVSYYNIYVHLHEVDGACVADIFPVNGMQHGTTSHQYVASVFD